VLCHLVCNSLWANMIMQETELKMSVLPTFSVSWIIILTLDVNILCYRTKICFIDLIVRFPFQDPLNVIDIALDSPKGYILEMDLKYPQHLHDAHTDLSFCPTRNKSPDKRQDKLFATLYDKKRYVIHYRNLQQCTRHGFRITKIHRVL